MHFIRVIPISRGITKDELSYFSAQPIPEGSIISVSLRKKTIPAIVISSKDISASKTAIKTSDYKLKKIGKQESKAGIPLDVMLAVCKTADYFVTSPGAVLAEILPKTILDEIQERGCVKKKKKNKTRIAGEKLVLQIENKECLGTYKSMVREAFARNTSIFICVPSIADGERLFKVLQRGIEQYSVLLHSSFTKKKIKESWQKAVETKHPMLMIGTPMFLSIPRSDINTIIIEKEHSSYYKHSIRPFLDMRVFAEYIAAQYGARFVLSGMPLRTETMHRYKNGEFEELQPLKLKPATPTTAQHKIIDMKAKSKDGLNIKKTNLPASRHGFVILSEDLKKIIDKTEKSGERMFIFTARRGTASSTICNDCGHAVLCEKCNTPVALHSAPRVNVFLCHYCGATRSAKERCSVCQSWNLVALGIGIQRVESALKSEFPKRKIIIADRENLSTHKQTKSAVQLFYDTPGSILLGTEMVLPYLNDPIEYVVVASADSLLSVPQWRISEKLFSLLLTMRELATKMFLIQTRRSENTVLKYAVVGNILDFYKQEILLREKLKYPPTYVLIKITMSGALPHLKKEFKKIEEMFTEHNIYIYTSPIKNREKHTMYGLMRIKKKAWPNEELVAKLRSLPLNITVTIDPENLF